MLKSNRPRSTLNRLNMSETSREHARLCPYCSILLYHAMAGVPDLLGSSVASGKEP
jgi:hypothetical protein